MSCKIFNEESDTSVFPVDALGVHASPDWITFNSTEEEFSTSMVAAFPKDRVPVVVLDED